MAGDLQKWQSQIEHLIWDADPSQYKRPKRQAVQLVQLIAVVIRDLASGELNLWAMSLVYTTLLSIVPLLAVSFSVLKAFGVQNIIKPLVFEFVEPLGARGVEIAERIVEFVENVNAGVLGGMGLAFLIYTVISLVSKIEDTFNRIWRIHNTRRWIERFSDYLSVLLIGPVMIFAAMGVTASMMNSQLAQKLIAIEPFGSAYYVAGVLVPYLLIFAAFTYVYMFLPNTTVRFKPALSGAVVAGLLWKAAGWVFAAFIANSTRYNAIYSGFAILVVFMIWVYTSWLIFIVGAQIAYYVQHQAFIRPEPPDRELNQQFREKLALTLMFWICDNYSRGDKNSTLDALSQRFQLPQEVLLNVLDKLEHYELITQTTEETPRYVPARGLDSITLRDILGSVRQSEKGRLSFDDKRLDIPEVETAMTTMAAALDSAIGHRSVAEWISGAHRDG